MGIGDISMVSFLVVRVYGFLGSSCEYLEYGVLIVYADWSTFRKNRSLVVSGVRDRG